MGLALSHMDFWVLNVQNSSKPFPLAGGQNMGVPL